MYLMHDFSASRTSNVDMRIREHTLSELRTIDVGKWKGSEWTGERIPTLEQALSTIPDEKRVFAEVKCGPEVIPELVRVLKSSEPKPIRTALIGFDLDVMTQVKAALPTHQVYWLTSSISDEIISWAKAAGLDGLDVHSSGIDAALAAKTHAAGLKLYAWTVGSPNLANVMIEAGVDGITTNSPAWLVGLIGA